MRPRLLDLFSGAGGSAVGYHRAGFDVVGVDHLPQPNYPYEFVQADALEVLGNLLGQRRNDRQAADACLVASGLDGGEHGIREFVRGAGVSLGHFHVQVDEDFARHGSPSVGVVSDCAKPAFRVKDFDAIHASPPCQAHSTIGKQVRGRDPKLEHPDLVAPTRDLLVATGLPYVIENVVGAPLVDPVQICGSSLGLDVRRHRLFETNWPLMVPPCVHGWQTPRFRSLDSRRHKARTTVPVHGSSQLASVVGVHGNLNYAGEIELRKKAMEIDWMSSYELTQAIPPAYTELIGAQLAGVVAAKRLGPCYSGDPDSGDANVRFGSRTSGASPEGNDGGAGAENPTAHIQGEGSSLAVAEADGT